MNRAILSAIALTTACLCGAAETTRDDPPEAQGSSMKVAYGDVVTHNAVMDATRIQATAGFWLHATALRTRR